MKYSFILLILAFILLFLVFKSIDYLAKEDYISLEPFTSGSSHNVDLPLTTTSTCNNFCSPTGRCALTGGQCFADTDCQGCSKQPSSSMSNTVDVIGNNDAGKLTVGVTPTYSPLTSGYGTAERIITKDLYGKPAVANFGFNTWRKSYNEEDRMFNKRYKPNQLRYMPNYPTSYSITGVFSGDGPLPSNY